jgi:hypothetical protein
VMTMAARSHVGRPAVERSVERAGPGTGQKLGDTGGVA